MTAPAVNEKGEFVPPPVKGYRALSSEEVALMNEIKAEGLRLEALIQKVRDRIADQSVSDGDTYRRVFSAEPARWASIGRTHFQEGLMALTRAVAQPEFF